MVAQRQAETEDPQFADLYKMGTVANAKQRNYQRTLVYYPPGGEGIAKRLAAELGVGTRALPGGDNPLGGAF